MIEEFRRSGAEIIFLNRAINRTAEDELLLQVQGIIAEYERTKNFWSARGAGVGMPLAVARSAH